MSTSKREEGTTGDVVQATTVIEEAESKNVNYDPGKVSDVAREIKCSNSQDVDDKTRGGELHTNVT